MYVVATFAWLFLGTGVPQWVECGAPQHYSATEPALRTSPSGLNLIKTQESCSLWSYPDPASPRAREERKPLAKRAKNWKKLSGTPWTIGWGHTGSEVTAGLFWDQPHCDRQFVYDIWAREIQLTRMVKVPLNQNQWDALMSLLFNIGEDNFAQSDLLVLLNKRDYHGARHEFKRWRKARGVVQLGLANRRAAEMELFNRPTR